MVNSQKSFFNHKYRVKQFHEWFEHKNICLTRRSYYQLIALLQ